MDDFNITMEEYIQLMADKARRLIGKLLRTVSLVALPYFIDQPWDSIDASDLSLKEGVCGRDMYGGKKSDVDNLVAKTWTRGACKLLVDELALSLRCLDSYLSIK
ncbi:hypothetical protein Tco_0859744 [Tanacetum coccineum]|uniref:Uncharacterized protein n=1 Tax=Tanacetum coccineum TaxID=301880 RepID=A0ABQ5BG59_9ASTR